MFCISFSESIGNKFTTIHTIIWKIYHRILHDKHQEEYEKSERDHCMDENFECNNLISVFGEYIP